MGSFDLLPNQLGSGSDAYSFEFGTCFSFNKLGCDISGDLLFSQELSVKSADAVFVSVPNRDVAPASVASDVTELRNRIVELFGCSRDRWQETADACVMRMERCRLCVVWACRAGRSVFCAVDLRPATFTHHGGY